MEPVSYCKICDVRLPGIDHIKWYYMSELVKDIGCDDIRHTLSQFLVNIYHNMKYENPSNTCGCMDARIAKYLWKQRNSELLDVILSLKVYHSILIYKKVGIWYIRGGFNSHECAEITITLDSEIGFPWIHKLLTQYGYPYDV